MASSSWGSVISWAFTSISPSLLANGASVAVAEVYTLVGCFISMALAQTHMARFHQAAMLGVMPTAQTTDPRLEQARELIRDKGLSRKDLQLLEDRQHSS